MKSTRPPSRPTQDRRSQRGQQDHLINSHLGLAYQLASRYRDKGVPLEDMRQVAALALVKAANSFSPERGSTFASYAIPTINGELRKHFRDRGWWVRPPRPLQELESRVRRAEQDLTHELQHTPTDDEIAAYVDAQPDRVREARSLGSCFTPGSLSPAPDEPAFQFADAALTVESPSELSDLRMTLTSAVRTLPPRDQQIVRLRFVHELTQAEIGSRLGITQMQVSRLLTRIVSALRGALAEEGDDEPSTPELPAARRVHSTLRAVRN